MERERVQRRLWKVNFCSEYEKGSSYKPNGHVRQEGMSYVALNTAGQPLRGALIHVDLTEYVIII